jgi:hypothetical protein
MQCRKQFPTLSQLFVGQPARQERAAYDRIARNGLEELASPIQPPLNLNLVQFHFSTLLVRSPRGVALELKVREMPPGFNFCRVRFPPGAPRSHELQQRRGSFDNGFGASSMGKMPSFSRMELSIGTAHAFSVEIWPIFAVDEASNRLMKLRIR